jgi:hypothetical protein
MPSGASAWLIAGLSVASLSAFATRRCGSSAAVTIAETPFVRAPMLDSILQSPSPESSTTSANGLPMLHFRRKPFSQEAGCAPPVRFDTGRLSGLYPFATATAHRCNGFSRHVNAVTLGRDDRCDELVQGSIPMQFDAGHLTAEGAIEVGRRLSAAFARKHARASDVSH